MSDPAEEYLPKLAELTVSVALNLQPGQVLGITTEPGKEAAVRAIAELAYARGALYVDPWSFDVQVKHSRLVHAAADTLAWVPPWIGERLRALGELNGAWVTLRGPVDPYVMDDIDPARLGIDRLPRVPDSLPIINNGLCNWAMVPVPTPGWARALFPSLEPDEAYARLWREIAFVLRLDEPDVSAAWDERFTQLETLAPRLTGLALDAIRFEGPGTDLTIGLLPSSTWRAGRATTSFGVTHAVNVPSEELWTAPDPQRADGAVTATRPLYAEGAIVEGLRLEFRDGRVTSVAADRGAEVIEALIRDWENADRLGELALVDRASRIGQLGTVFYETLLDENAASHIALGNAYPDTAGSGEDLERINVSKVHTDFMIGSDEVSVTGLLQDGSQVPLLRGGDWQI